MNNCAVCDDCFQNENPNKIICDGICRQPFHTECVNFSKNALICYREMPNLQWFCDSCIVQTHLSNVSSSLFNKFNSAVGIPASTPSYVQRSLIAAKRKRNRNHFPNAKSNNGSASLVHRFHKFDLGISNANGSIHEMQPENRHEISNANGSTHEMQPVNHHEISNAKGSMNEVQTENNFVKSPGENGSNPLITTEFTQCDVTQFRPQDKSADYKGDLKEPSELKTPPAKSSFAEVLTKSPVTETDSENSTIRPQNVSTQSPRTTSSQSDTLKVLYVSKLHRSTTEVDIVNHLLRENVIKSAEEVSCKMLVSPDVDLRTLSFISFKITASSEVFDSMFRSEVWPKTVVFREFVDR